MGTISTPDLKLGLDNHSLDDRATLTISFQEFADAARAAGWDKGEVAYGLLELARLKLKNLADDVEGSAFLGC